MSPIHHHLIK